MTTTCRRSPSCRLVTSCCRARATKRSKCGRCRRAIAWRRTRAIASGCAWFGSTATERWWARAATTTRCVFGASIPKNRKSNCASTITLSSASRGRRKQHRRRSMKRLARTTRKAPILGHSSLRARATRPSRCGTSRRDCAYSRFSVMTIG